MMFYGRLNVNIYAVKGYEIMASVVNRSMLIRKPLRRPRFTRVTVSCRLVGKITTKELNYAVLPIDSMCLYN